MVDLYLIKDIDYYHQSPIIHSNEVTIIIPARNEERRLPHLLQSLQGQQGIYEVIVMDDGSKDNTKRLHKHLVRQCTRQNRISIDNGLVNPMPVIKVLQMHNQSY